VAKAQYLVRLDDACPWMDRDRWGRLEALFDNLGVQPLVAVIPECRDPEVKPFPEDPGFWDTVRRWQAKGWSLALHGHTHELGPCGPSLVPLNRYTEFAGRPEAEQRAKIRAGWQTMAAQGVEPTYWVAPAHTFDATTLKVLSEETSLRWVSDGLSNRPFVRHGFRWVPQQLWRPRNCPAGVWTLCLHPNDVTPAFETSLAAFLGSHRSSMGSWTAVVGADRRWGLGDLNFELSFRALRAAKRILKK
jgi:predicted deacetylase